jgi:hypothetical protein
VSVSLAPPDLPPSVPEVVWPSTALNIVAGTTQNNRRVFLSPALKQDLHVSGTPQLDLRASLDKPQSNLSAMLVDYGPSTQITRSGDGISTPANAPSDCWGSSSTRVSAVAACAHDGVLFASRNPQRKQLTSTDPRRDRAAHDSSPVATTPPDFTASTSAS